jgi:hypothetical protein
VLQILADGFGADPADQRAAAASVKAALQEDLKSGGPIANARAQNPNVQSIVVTTADDIARARDVAMAKAAAKTASNTASKPFSTATRFLGAIPAALQQIVPGAPEGALGGQAVAMTVSSSGGTVFGAEMMVGASLPTPIAAGAVVGTLQGYGGYAQAKAMGLGDAASEGVGVTTAVVAGGVTAVDVAIAAAIVAGATISLPVLLGVAVAGGIAGGVGYVLSRSMPQ